MRTARQWGKTPTEFWALSEQDRAYMMALTRTESRMSVLEAQLSLDRTKEGK